MAHLLVAPDTPVEPDAPGFTLSAWIELAPFEELLGMRIVRAAAGEAELTMPFVVKLAQGGGLLHGGAITSLADTAVALAIKSLLPERTVFATTELSTRFLTPLRSGLVRAQARVSGPCGRTFTGEAVVTAADNTLVARFASTFRVARGQGFDE